MNVDLGGRDPLVCMHCGNAPTHCGVRWSWCKKCLIKHCCSKRRFCGHRAKRHKCS